MTLYKLNRPKRARQDHEYDASFISFAETYPALLDITVKTVYTQLVVCSVTFLVIGCDSTDRCGNCGLVPEIFTHGGFWAAIGRLECLFSY